jgi:molybdate transport system substrate-binding protein
MSVRSIAAALFCLIVMTASSHLKAAAQGEPVRILASNGIKAPFEALSKQTEGAIGHPLAVQYGTTTVHKQKIESGAAFDVAILTSEAIDALIKEGKISARSRADIGSSGIGVGVKSGAKKPDIKTPDAMKQTLLNAKSVTYAEDGASKPHIEKMFNELGITDKMKPKLVLVQGADASIAAVETGKAEMIITLSSEIMPVKDLDLVGPLPDKFQNYVHFAAGVSAAAKNADTANSLIKFVTGPKAAPTFEAKGVKPGK